MVRTRSTPNRKRKTPELESTNQDSPKDNPRCPLSKPSDTPKVKSSRSTSDTKKSLRDDRLRAKEWADRRSAQPHSPSLSPTPSNLARRPVHSISYDTTTKVTKRARIESSPSQVTAKKEKLSKASELNEARRKAAQWHKKRTSLSSAPEVTEEENEDDALSFIVDVEMSTDSRESDKDSVIGSRVHSLSESYCTMVTCEEEEEDDALVRVVDDEKATKEHEHFERVSDARRKAFEAEQLSKSRREEEKAIKDLERLSDAHRKVALSHWYPGKKVKQLSRSNEFQNEVKKEQSTTGMARSTSDPTKRKEVQFQCQSPLFDTSHEPQPYYASSPHRMVTAPMCNSPYPPSAYTHPPPHAFTPQAYQPLSSSSVGNPIPPTETPTPFAMTSPTLHQYYPAAPPPTPASYVKHEDEYKYKTNTRTSVSDHNFVNSRVKDEVKDSQNKPNVKHNDHEHVNVLATKKAHHHTFIPSQEGTMLRNTIPPFFLTLAKIPVTLLKIIFQFKLRLLRTFIYSVFRNVFIVVMMICLYFLLSSIVLHNYNVPGISWGSLLVDSDSAIANIMPPCFQDVGSIITFTFTFIRWLVHSMGSVLWKMISFYPLWTVGLTSIYIVRRWIRSRQNSRARFRNLVTVTRDLAYNKLIIALETDGCASLHLRDEIAHELYPQPCRDRSDLLHTVWPCVVQEVRADNRVTKSRKNVKEKSLEWWEWVAKAEGCRRRAGISKKDTIKCM